MCVTDKPWFDDKCRHAVGLKQEANLRWTHDCSRVNWEEFVKLFTNSEAKFVKSLFLWWTGV